MWTINNSWLDLAYLWICNPPASTEYSFRSHSSASSFECNADINAHILSYIFLQPFVSLNHSPTVSFLRYPASFPAVCTYDWLNDWAGRMSEWMTGRLTNRLSICLTPLLVPCRELSVRINFIICKRGHKIWHRINFCNKRRRLWPALPPTIFLARFFFTLALPPFASCRGIYFVVFWMNVQIKFNLIANFMWQILRLTPCAHFYGPQMACSDRRASVDNKQCVCMCLCLVLVLVLPPISTDWLPACADSQMGFGE